MFLKSVKARGFKSFGRPVEFGFEPGITVVVGPNGSGKSNIMDAIVWAMGEQSPSALRGASMRDVIFTGSDKLSPAGMAEVEIAFDNSSGQIPIEFSEVTISRRVYRDGESSYFINRSACRLIDVAELLSDAGLGRDSHSIISQGKVDAILESRPQERRAHIEEAAGLGKFKKRRRRAELKLDAVKRNLERLTDVEEEIKAQLRPLKRQATAAERSAKLDLQIAQAQARLIKGRLEVLGAELAAAESASREANGRRAEIERELAQAGEKRRQTEDLLTGSLAAHKERAGRFYSLKSRRDALESRREALAERRGMIAQGTRRAEARLQNLQGQMERAEAELKMAAAEHGESEARLSQVETELELRQEELARLEEEIDRRRRDNREKNRRVGELSALKDRYAHQIEYLSRRKEKLADSMERAAQEILEHRRELGELDGTIRADEEKLAGLRQKADAAESNLNALSEQMAGLDGQRQALASELRHVAEDLQIAKARLTFISDSESGRSGLPAAAKEISANHGLKALVELIDVEAGYEKALSAVLGGTLFALAVDSMEEAGGYLGTAMESRLGSVDFLLPGAGEPGERSGDESHPCHSEQNSCHPESSEGSDYLIDHISIAAGQDRFIRALLAGVRVVEENELAGLAGAAGDSIWVTRDGIVYHAGKGLLSYKTDVPSSVILRQRNERRQLEKEREAAESRRLALETEIAAIDEKISSQKAPRLEAEEQGRRMAREIEEIEKELAASGRRRLKLIQEAEIKEANRAHLQAEDSRIDEEITEAQQKFAETEKSLAEAGEIHGSEAGGDEEMAAARQALAKQVTELQISAARVRERERVAALTMERTGPAILRLRQDLAATGSELSAYRQLAPSSGRLLAVLERLSAVFEEVLRSAESQLKEGEEESNRHSAALRSLSQAEADLQQQLHKASDDTTGCEVGLARLRDQAAEQAGRLEDVQHGFPDAGLGEEEAAPAPELEAVEENIERMKRRRELIGPVNPLAQQEYEEMLARQEFLDEQRADLEKSLKELAGLIRELTGRIESSFTETFEAVQKNFTEVIGSLFPGGEGRLTLVEEKMEAAEETDDSQMADEGEELPEDESAEVASAAGDRRGIEISVKPARKAVRSLSLLSGGERSLVAIAFLFAIFLARPAPFYILDEVEAALDDLNIDRLLGMLRRFQSRTQFIVITHQKRTMEVADVLYGISMSEDGTSKVLSRRMPRDGGDATTDPDDKPVDTVDENDSDEDGDPELEPAAVAG